MRYVPAAVTSTPWPEPSVVFATAGKGGQGARDREVTGAGHRAQLGDRSSRQGAESR